MIPRRRFLTTALATLTAHTTPAWTSEKKPRLVVIIGEDEYQTSETLPEFVRSELEPAGLACTILHEDPVKQDGFPGLTDALKHADGLLISVRRRRLPPAELAAIRAHIAAGRGLAAIRTSSHAFVLRPGTKTQGTGEEWPDFGTAILGANYTGHHGTDVETKVTPATAHPILEGVEARQIIGRGSLYKSAPLATDTTVLLTGEIPGKTAEPLAWVRNHGQTKAPIFYTSLGHRGDFTQPPFRRLLRQAVQWTLTPPQKPQ